MIAQSVLPFKLEKTDEHLTPHAGLIPVHEFHLAMGLDRLLDSSLPLPGSNRGYRPSEVVMPLVLMLLGGGGDLTDIRVIAQDAALRQACNLKKIPAESTLGDLLRRYGSQPHTMQGMSRVEDKLTQAMLWEGKTSDFTLDADATIIAADKQDATVAYDGTKGFHPMLGFLAENKWLIHHEFRTGSASPAGGMVPFIKTCQARMPKGCRIARFRSDSAAYNHGVTDHCEKTNVLFAIGADWDKAVKALYRGLPVDGWTQFMASGSRKKREVAETIHSFNKGAGSFRLIFVRDVEEQGTLFETDFRGRAIASNFPESTDAVSIVEWYNDRGNAENYIKELKHGAGLLHFPCGQFDANAAWMSIGALTYDLFILQQSLALPPELESSTIATVRWRLYQVAAKVVAHARSIIVKVAADATTFQWLERLRTASQRIAVQNGFT